MFFLILLLYSLFYFSNGCFFHENTLLQKEKCVHVTPHSIVKRNEKLYDFILIIRLFKKIIGIIKENSYYAQNGGIFGQKINIETFSEICSLGFSRIFHCLRKILIFLKVE